MFPAVSIQSFNIQSFNTEKRERRWHGSVPSWAHKENKMANLSGSITINGIGDVELQEIWGD
jgi:hypothetical protein